MLWYSPWWVKEWPRVNRGQKINSLKTYDRKKERNPSIWLEFGVKRKKSASTLKRSLHPATDTRAAYISIYMYTYMYVYTCIYLHGYVSKSISRYQCTYTYTYIYIYNRYLPIPIYPYMEYRGSWVRGEPRGRERQRQEERVLPIPRPISNRINHEVSPLSKRYKPIISWKENKQAEDSRKEDRCERILGFPTMEKPLGQKKEKTREERRQGFLSLLKLGANTLYPHMYRHLYT